MATPVEMPKLGNTVEECLLLAWHKHKGDAVSAGDVLAEIETDKSSFDLAAPADGSLLELFFDEGAMVPVFANVCVIGEPGEAIDEFRPQTPTPAAAAPIGAPSNGGGPPAAPANGAPGNGGGGLGAAVAPSGVSVGGGGDPSAAASSAAAIGPANGHGGWAGALVQGDGVASLRSPTSAPAAPSPASAGRLSPRARRFAAEHGFRPAPMIGSGPGGRVLERDVRAQLRAAPRVSGAARALIDAGYEIRGAGTGVDGMIRAVDLVPPPVRLSGMRERIASRMRESLASTAQYTLHTSADATGLLAFRRAVKATPGAPDITINDLVVYCAIRAVLEVPAVNAELIDGRLYQHAHVNLGFACDTPRGLVVPVVRHSEGLTVAELSGRCKALAARAVAGALSPDDMTGATFTVSNLGGLGIESFTPVLNPPQVAILGVDAIALKPVRGPDGEIGFIDAIGLSATLDHQVVDGAPGARFLGVVKAKISSVESLCSI